MQTWQTKSANCYKTLKCQIDNVADLKNAEQRVFHRKNRYRHSRKRANIFQKKLTNTWQTSSNFGDIGAASVPERAGRERAAPPRRDHPLPGHDRGTLKKLGYYSLVLTLTSTTHSYFDYFD